MSSPPDYNHIIKCVFDPGDPIGFMYTVGMPRQELFALNVPRSWVKNVACCMNFLSTRQVSESQTVQSGGVMYLLRGLEGREDLMSTHLCQLEGSAEVLELFPFLGWRRTDDFLECVEREGAEGEEVKE